MQKTRLVLHCKTGIGKTLITQALLLLLHKEHKEDRASFLFSNDTLYNRDMEIHRLTAVSNVACGLKTTYLHTGHADKDNETVLAGTRDQFGTEIKITDFYRRWFNAKIVIIDESDLLMFKDLDAFNELVKHWIANETTVICATATPQLTNDKAETSILTKWWGFNTIQFNQETSSNSEVVVDCENHKWTEEEQKTYVIEAAKLNPVLVCKNRGTFDTWVQ